MPDDTKNAPARNLRKAPVSPCEIEASGTHDDSCGYVEGDDHVAEILASAGPPFHPNQGERSGVMELHRLFFLRGADRRW